MGSARPWSRLALALLLLLALGATRAEAHSVMSTSGPFYGGIKHFFLSPDDVLAAVAFGLLVGLRKGGLHGSVVAVLPLAWLAGGALAAWGGAVPAAGDLLSAGSLLVLGLLVAADRGLRAPVVVPLGILLGGLHGYLNGAAMRPDGLGAALLQLVGVGLSALVLVAYLFALLELVNLGKRPWVRIVARVLGSWIAASGLLLLGWSLRAGR